MSARILAYCYSEGPVNGSTAAMQHNSTLAVVEQATPGTTSYARPTTPKLLTDQLADIKTEWDASTPAGLYSITHDLTTNRITIASTNGTNFRPTMVGNSANWTGFTQGLVGWALTWTGDDPPQAMARLLGVTVEPAEDWAQVDLTAYRHGRAVGVAWGNHQAHRVTMHFSGENIDIIKAGYVIAGRVRIWQGAIGTAYSPTNLGGYVDGWIVAADDPHEAGDTGNLWQLSLVLAVPR